ncbi:MAG: hypothetical protein V4564_22405 [Pseudomonadota bacterium]|uniref:hypothetical protein n=1 Tax=Sphingomonas sp. ERG5 TaxID=1381597 RepID=UPI00054C6BBF|nr:hypothetical protein [Sphingomonas sp. ERG5]
MASSAAIVIRSVLATVAGLAVVVIGSTVTDQAMHATGIIPPGAMWNPWHNLLALAYRCVVAVAGGYVTAWLAPRNAMRHVMILAVIGLAAGTAGVIATAGLNLGPRWYPIAVAVTGFPCVLIGGLWQRRRAALAA